MPFGGDTDSPAAMAREAKTAREGYGSTGGDALVPPLPTLPNTWRKEGPKVV